MVTGHCNHQYRMVLQKKTYIISWTITINELIELKSLFTLWKNGSLCSILWMSLDALQN